MEEPPETNPAEQPENEPITEDLVFELTVKKGKLHPEALEALKKLVVQEYEKKAEQLKTARGNIEVAIEIAKLYHRLGYSDRALDELETIGEAMGSDPTVEDLLDGYYDLIEEFKKDL